ncbi:MAG TPA: xanthine dehydrogenase family protein subunit M [Candidatus Dormibacteraeota bacterium]|nr:xanthine dehydrogenase family protein subunit M [Candidatus Dormibacteraeota bacterium]
MQPFDYARPATLSEALQLLDRSGPEACLLAGGTDVVVALRNRTLRPKLVVDLKRVDELRPAISEEAGWLTIAATTVIADINDDHRIRTRFRALVDAGATVGSDQIRNRATLTGNICHASPAADTAPALLAYGAVVNVAGSQGTRRVNLSDFFIGPGNTVLRQGELVSSISLPLSSERRGATFARITRRRGVDLATVSLCCIVEASGRTTFAYGAVGPKPFVVVDDSGVLADPGAGADAKDEALRRVLTHASPISDVRGSREYREAMLHVMSRRALQTSIERLAAA